MANCFIMPEITNQMKGMVTGKLENAGITHIYLLRRAEWKTRLNNLFSA